MHVKQRETIILNRAERLLPSRSSQQEKKMNTEKKERFSKMLIQGVIALAVVEYLYLFIRYF